MPATASGTSPIPLAASVMIQAPLRRLRARSVALVPIALVAGCTRSRLLEQHANPAYVGKPFKRVLVVAVTQDNVERRLFEDRMTALLDQRSITGVQAYSILGGKPAAVEEAKLRAAIAEAGADGMLIARATRSRTRAFTIPGSSVAIGVRWVASSATTAASGRRAISAGNRLGAGAHHLRDAALDTIPARSHGGHARHPGPGRNPRRRAADQVRGKRILAAVATREN